MMEQWNNGIREFFLFYNSIIPSFHSSIIPFFHFSLTLFLPIDIGHNVIQRTDDRE